MKSFRGIAIASLLVAGPVLAAGTAWANTELVPGSRLVAPYWDISGDRSTLMFVTNVSKSANLQRSATAADLNGVCNLGVVSIAPLGGATCSVHLEFYDKTCKPFDTSIDLSARDIDQMDLKTDSDLGGVKGLPSGFGWVDIDVRRSPHDRSSTSVQANVLMGTVVITDSGSDFAVAYPMASSQGTGAGGIGGDIVSRIGTGGIANVWGGGYESFPARLFVPMFFAEGSNHGATFSSTLAIAGPAQAINGGEAPGQNLGEVSLVDPATLVDASVEVLDACENRQSDSFDDHYVMGTLDELLSATVIGPYNSTCAYPAGDVDRKPVTAGGTAADAFHGGWLDILNAAQGEDFLAGVGSGFPFYERGMVGVLVQNTASTGDATRLWGDCAYGDSTDTPGVRATLGCRVDFSLVDFVSHEDIK